MIALFNKIVLKDWEIIISDSLKSLNKRWYIPLTAFMIGAAMGYWYIKQSKPTYTATISFVLSTESRQVSGIANLVAQLGFDAGTNGTENIFSGDNIIELFKSRKIVSMAMLSKIDTNQRFIDFFVKRQFPDRANSVVPFPSDQAKFTNAQKSIFNSAVSQVINSFTVFKKANLVFYYLSATSTDQDIAYHIAERTLHETASYFIETRTQGASSSLALLKKETDSLSGVISQLYRTTASVNDQTFNINPAFMSQRSQAFFNQTKVTAIGAAYAEAMRNLEIAKINLQKETPLYRIIDEPERPLSPQKPSPVKYLLILGTLFLFAVSFLVSIPQFIASYKKIMASKAASTDAEGA